MARCSTSHYVESAMDLAVCRAIRPVELYDRAVSLAPPSCVPDIDLRSTTLANLQPLRPILPSFLACRADLRASGFCSHHRTNYPARSCRVGWFSLFRAKTKLLDHERFTRSSFDQTPPSVSILDCILTLDFREASVASDFRRRANRP